MDAFLINMSPVCIRKTKKEWVKVEMSFFKLMFNTIEKKAESRKRREKNLKAIEGMIAFI